MMSNEDRKRVDAVDASAADERAEQPTGQPAVRHEGPVWWQARGNILIVTLNRPRVMNAVNLAMAEGLRAALNHFEATDGLRVAVLVGAGGNFSAGMDLKAFQAGEVPSLEGGGFAGITSAPPRKPIIAAVEGWALAGGFEVALACDFIVAARTARFGLPEVTRGLVAAGGGLVELPRRIPPALAMRLALTGAPMAAQAAADAGLVVAVTEEGEALAAALDLADQIGRNSPHAVQLSKQIIRRSRDWPASGWEAAQDELLGDLYSSPDAEEGARAFAQRRAPDWSRSVR